MLFPSRLFPPCEHQDECRPEAAAFKAELLETTRRCTREDAQEGCLPKALRELFDKRAGAVNWSRPRVAGGRARLRIDEQHPHHTLCCTV